MPISRFAPILLSLCCCFAQQPVFQRYCLGCHNDKAKIGNFSLQNLPAENAEAWEKVVRKMRARTMPPIGLPRPDDATYKSVVAGLEKTLDARKPDPGRTESFRRLNRTEYRNAIRDLLALDVDVHNLLPADESSHGFDNITVADLSPTLLERYLNAAQKISRLAIGTPPKSPGGETFQLPPDLTQEEHFEDLPVGTRGGLSVRYTFPVDAEYEIVVRLARDRNEHVEGLHAEHDVEILLDGERVGLFTVRPPKGSDDHSQVDKDVHVRIPVKAGSHEVAAAFPKKPSLLLESERQPYPAHFNMDRHPRITPAVYQLTVNGPYSVKGHGESASRKRIFVCSAQDEACAKQIFSRLTRLAYRRPITDADLTAPMKFFRQAGDFEQGVEMGLRSILVSPEFLFRVELDPDGVGSGTAYPLSNLALASRLSFFLWSSIPDDELLKADLKKPDVLQAQVSRMLKDERSRALVSNFAEQWLYLRNLASTTPDMRTFVDFDDNLRQAFRTETEMFFESIMREDRSILDLLSADYTFVNERLAKHYGIPNVYGSRFRRVTFPGRGGLLRQGSVLTVTSYATRTSPVIRGKWVLDNLLGVPPPPPPPKVPALKDNDTGLKARTMRERIAEHRRNPACSGCHQLMDPVGFAFENYDAVGRWRSTDDGKPIDATGGLPDGSKFEGVGGLQQALLNHPEVFTSTFTEKLLTYALGRGVEYYDAPAVRKVVRDAAAKDYRFSAFIAGIVNSTPFQMRRSK